MTGILLFSGLFFFLALCTGHYSETDYKLPFKKKLAGWALITLACLNLAWDIAIAVNTFNRTPEVDSDLIKERLTGVKKMPSYWELSNREREDFLRQQALDGIEISNLNNYEIEHLYMNSIFIEMFGIEEFRIRIYDTRIAMIEDSIIRYNNSYIKQIFEECLSPYQGGDYNPKKGLGSRWYEYKDADYDTKLTLLNQYAYYSTTNINTIEPIKLTLFKVNRALAVFFIILGWGIYILKSKPIYSPIWKRIIKVIVYIAMSVSLFATVNLDIFKSLIWLGVEFILLMIVLVLNYSRVGKKTDTKHEVQKNLKTNPSSHSRKGIYKYIVWKFLLSLLLPCVLGLSLMFSVLWDIDIPYFKLNDDLSPWLVFYLPYNILILIYYEILIWKSRITGSQILIVPLLKKIGLFRNMNVINYKKLLIITIFPALLITLIFPMFAGMLFNLSWKYETLCHILLIIPILVWIYALVMSYSYQWLKHDVNDVEDS